MRAEPAHQRLRAVVPGADADALAAEDLADVDRLLEALGTVTRVLQL